MGGGRDDERAVEGVRVLESGFWQVHRAVCPEDGPTSKADCLNWIYQRMLLFEEHYGGEVEIVITHDAEDLIHPESFSVTNTYAGDFEMIQIPVLPLPTPFRNILHGMYCAEFSEWQINDIPSPQMMRTVIPTNGRLTGATRTSQTKPA